MAHCAGSSASQKPFLAQIQDPDPFLGISEDIIIQYQDFMYDCQGSLLNYLTMSVNISSPQKTVQTNYLLDIAQMLQNKLTL